MLSEYINKLSKLINSPVLTPYNLLENLELENYLSINFFKQDGSILADIVFLICEDRITYRYVFDADNFLQKIYLVDGDSLIVQFDRTLEKEELIEQVKNNNPLKECI